MSQSSVHESRLGTSFDAGVSANTGGLVGREAELRVLRQIVGLIRDAGAAVSLRGAPGVGKSTLLRGVAEFARNAGCQVLETTGIETESGLPFAGLQHLLEPLLPDIDSLPPVQQRALLGALGVRDGEPPEVFLVALAALNLMSEHAGRRPIVVLVDDIHWLDVPSGEVLSFVARRVGQESMVIIGAYRHGHDVAFSSAVSQDLDVAALDDAASRRLLQMCGRELGLDETETILKHAEGNPLALVELPAIWRQADAASFAGPAPSIPLSVRLEQVFASRISEMPARTRDALLIAAIDSEDELSEILAGASILAGQQVTAEMLEPADKAQIVRFDEMHVRFRHPLVRSGILQYESVTRRQAANVALSDVLVSQPYRRTWHLAQGTQGPNDAVADELEIHHTESIRRGSLDAAIAALERSAQLTTDPQKRVRRLLLAAQHAFGMGRADLVDRLVTTAEEDELSKLDRARVEWLREIFNDGAPGDANRILELCAAAEESAAEGDIDLALELLLAAALRCFWTESGPQPRARVVEVAERMDGLQEDPRCIAVIAIAEPILRGSQTVERLSSIGIETVVDANQLRLLGMAGRAVGAETHAADFLARAETKLRDQGRLGHLAHVLTLKSSVWLDLGDWDRVRESMVEGQQLAQDTGQPLWSTGQTALAARVAGLTDDVDQALQHAEVVELASSARVNNVLLCEGQQARGFAWISAGRHADAYAVLKPLFDPSDPHHHPREQFSGLMFLAEAAARSDQREDAREVLERMEELATITTSPILHTHLLYARAVLADPRDAEALFIDGLDHDLTRWPLVRARLQLAYGAWLRRQRRVAESREHLRAAAAMLDLIGATAWVREATIELRASGELGEVRGSASSAASLSPQELQIARLAADGLSNREIGERLYLSPRTVGSHLYRIFPKLGVTSRAQLASRLVADPPRPDQDHFTKEAERAVHSPKRLAAVRATGLLDTPPEAPFDALSALAAELMDVPYAFVTIVDDTRSFWKSCFGDVGRARQKAVADSFCQYVIGVDGPLLIDDARSDPRTASNPSIDSMGVVAWAGHPIRDLDGEMLGTFCVADTRVREWTPAHGRTLEAMAAAVAGEIRLRITAAEAERAAARSAELGDLARRLSESATTAEIGSAIAERGRPLFGASTATLVLVERKNHHVALYSSNPQVARWADVSGTLSQRTVTPGTDAIRTEAEVVIRNPAELKDRYPNLVSIAQACGIFSALSEPLIARDGRVLGALSLSWSVESGFETIDRQLLVEVLGLCANTIERSIRQEDPREHRGAQPTRASTHTTAASTDPSTGRRPSGQEEGRHKGLRHT